MTQAEAWSRAATGYAAKFIDPYRDDVRSPLLKVLKRIPSPEGKVVGDLGCGTGPLLPFLAKRFRTVHAVDFAAAMLTRARGSAAKLDNVQFHASPLTDLHTLHGELDIALAINSLVLADVRELATALEQIYACLRPGGWFVGIVPAMDSVHYLTMLFLDRALHTGKPLEAARLNAAHHADHVDFDFAFGQCEFDGLKQHFWQPFEVHFRLKQAGFRRIRLAKVHLAWEQFSWSRAFTKHPAPWDWFFLCRKARRA